MFDIYSELIPSIANIPITTNKLHPCLCTSWAEIHSKHSNFSKIQRRRRITFNEYTSYDVRNVLVFGTEVFVKKCIITNLNFNLNCNDRAGFAKIYFCFRKYTIDISPIFNIVKKIFIGEVHFKLKSTYCTLHCPRRSVCSLPCIVSHYLTIIRRRQSDYR
jgi:hypothetical protein